MIMILGKKVGMTQVYDEAGKMTPVTVIQAGPCPILQVKTVKSDGYRALQLGFEEVKASRVRKPDEGHAKKANTGAKRFVREWRLTEKDQAEYNPGDMVAVSLFAEVKFVDVIGISKGKGFQGGTTSAVFRFLTGPNASTGRPAPCRAMPATAATAATSRRVSVWPAIWAWIASRLRTISWCRSTRTRISW